MLYLRWPPSTLEYLVSPVLEYLDSALREQGIAAVAFRYEVDSVVGILVQ